MHQIITLLFLFIGISACKKNQDFSDIITTPEASVSPASNAQASATTPSSSLSAPSNMILGTATDGSISLTWVDNAIDELIYEVEQCSGHNCTDFVALPRSPLPASSISFTQDGLNPDTVYSFRVRAVGLTGNSDYTTLSNVRTMALPNTSFTNGIITQNSIQFSWTVGTSDNKSFDVQRCSGTECSSFVSVFNSPLAPGTTSFTEFGLLANTVYRFRVRAVTDQGSSDWLTSSDILTLIESPTAISSTVIGATSASISWVDNSASETGFQVQYCAGISCTTFTNVVESPTISSPLLINELIASTIYNFRVRAISASNTSDWINIPTQFTTLLANPTSLSASSITETGITLTWTDNSTDELYYEIQRCLGDCNSDSGTFSSAPGSPLAANSTSYTATGLSVSTAYSHRIRAISAVGSSAWLYDSNRKTAPAAPTLLINSIATTPTSSTINLTWINNAIDATSTDIQSCSGISCTFGGVIPNTTPATVPITTGAAGIQATGLSPLTTYSFRVRANRNGVSSAWISITNITTLAATATCSATNTTVIDSGQKGVIAAVGRGLYSSVVMIPGTSSPAVAYYDGSTTGGGANIKYAWWNGSQFIVENVAGTNNGGAALHVNSIKLEFLTTGPNTGRPMIFWTTGSTFLRAAMRSTASNLSGTWSMTTLDSNAGWTARAVDVAVSPTDQVAVVFMTQSATTGRVRFLYCNAGCDSLTGATGFNTMTNVGETIENSAPPVAAVNQIGVGFCKSSTSGVYFPAAVYPGTTGTPGFHYSSCRGATNSDMLSCKGSAGWGTPLFIATMTASNLAASLYIDSTIASDTPKIAGRNSAGTLGQLFEVAQACDVAPTSLTAGAWTFGAANTFTNWGKLLHDHLSGRFHIIANNGTASVDYINTQLGVVSSTLNGAGIVESITLPAAGLGLGSADVSNLTGQIYASYGGSVAPFDITIGVVNNITEHSNSLNQVFYSLYPDTTGGINLPLVAGGQFRNVSAAATTSGKLGVAYVDHSIGAVSGSRLKFAFRDGTTSETAWEYVFIPNTTSPTLPSLAFDHLQKPWISYYDNANFRYYLLTNSSSNGSGRWTKYLFPIGAKIANGTGSSTDDTAVAMSYSNGIASPVMVIINSSAAGGTGIKTARLNPSTGVWSAVQTLDSLGASWATRLSADFDTLGNIAVAYYDLTTTRIRYNSYTYNTNTSAWGWQVSPTIITTIPTYREGISVKINPYNNMPSISYYDKANNSVLLSTCSAASTYLCSLASNWASTPVRDSLGISGIAATFEQMLNTGLSFNSAGIPFVSYLVGGASQSLSHSNNSNGSFAATELHASPNSYLSGATLPWNAAMAGFNVSSLRNSIGQLFNAYIGPNNWLYANTCE